MGSQEGLPVGGPKQSLVVMGGIAIFAVIALASAIYVGMGGRHGSSGLAPRNMTAQERVQLQTQLQQDRALLNQLFQIKQQLQMELSERQLGTESQTGVKLQDLLKQIEEVETRLRQADQRLQESEPK